MMDNFKMRPRSARERVHQGDIPLTHVPPCNGSPSEYRVVQSAFCKTVHHKRNKQTPEEGQMEIVPRE